MISVNFDYFIWLLSQKQWLFFLLASFLRQPVLQNHPTQSYLLSVFLLWKVFRFPSCTTCILVNLLGQTVPGRGPAETESCQSRKNTSLPFLGSQKAKKSKSQKVLPLPLDSLRPLLLQVCVLFNGCQPARLAEVQVLPKSMHLTAAAARVLLLLLLLSYTEEKAKEAWWCLPSCCCCCHWAPHQRTLHQHRSDINSCLWQHACMTSDQMSPLFYPLTPCLSPPYKDRLALCKAVSFCAGVSLPRSSWIEAGWA